jgi:hypothetical protein
MKLLVVGSCTGKKNKRGCPNSLTEEDFDNPATLARCEAELARWALPAATDFYWRHGTKEQQHASFDYDTEAAKVFETGSRLTT